MKIPLIEVLSKLSKFAHIEAELCDRVVGSGRKFFLQLQILVNAIRFCVFKGRYRGGNPKRHALLAELTHQRDELHRIQVEHRRGASRVIAGQRKNIFKAKSRDGFKVLAKFLPVFADTGDVNIRS